MSSGVGLELGAGADEDDEDLAALEGTRLHLSPRFTHLAQGVSSSHFSPISIDDACERLLLAYLHLPRSALVTTTFGLGMSSPRPGVSRSVRGCILHDVWL